MTIKPKQTAMGVAETGGEPVRHHDLDFLADTWIEDSVFDQVLAEQRTINAEIWK